MKSKRMKQAALVLLLLVFVYIWWGNLQVFLGQQEVTPYSVGPKGPSLTSHARSTSIPFRSPQVNPFRRNVSAPRATPNPGAPPQPRPQVEYLHTAYRLTGILPKGKSSQVIILTPQKSSQVLETGDSVGTWQLTAVGEMYAVFKQGKQNDTLWLVPPRK